MLSFSKYGCFFSIQAYDHDNNWMLKIKLTKWNVSVRVAKNDIEFGVRPVSGCYNVIYWPT